MPRRPELHVSILCGGPSAEDYLSRRSSHVIFESLEGQGFFLDILDWQRDGTIYLRKGPEGAILGSWPNLHSCFCSHIPDVIFNALHGENENSGQIQGFLELVGIPITGNDLRSSVVGMDKILSKDLFQNLEITTPRHVYLGPIHRIDPQKANSEIEKLGFTYPLILKATHGGSSEGVALLENLEDLETTITQWKITPSIRHRPLFVEEFIEGPEYCVGVFGHWDRDELTILPVGSIEYQGRFFDKSIKFQDDYSIACPDDLEDDLVVEMEKAARAVHRILRFQGFSRMDFKIRGEFAYALEVNTHPGMSPYSIIPNLIGCSDLSLGEAFSQMIDWAWETRIDRD